jgi:hypothetical protein
MEKFEYAVTMEAESREAGKTKIRNLIALGKKMASDEIENLKTTIDQNPNIVPFIRQIATEYNMKEIGLTDVISIATKAFKTFK